jgi:hypothetical protein
LFFPEIESCRLLFRFLSLLPLQPQLFPFQLSLFQLLQLQSLLVPLVALEVLQLVQEAEIVLEVEPGTVMEQVMVVQGPAGVLALGASPVLFSVPVPFVIESPVLLLHSA